MQHDADQRTVHVHAIGVVVNEAELAESIEEEADARAGGANHLGKSFQNQYMQIRLANACTMLRQTTISITGIALANGFSSGSHFSRAYKGEYRKSPSDERSP